MTGNSREKKIAQILDRAVHRGGEVYLTLSEAVECVEACEEHDLAVVGVEGFLIDDEATVPLMDQIADFSDFKATDWVSFRRKTNREAARFIGQVPQRVGIHVSLTLLHPDEWAATR